MMMCFMVINLSGAQELYQVYIYPEQIIVDEGYIILLDVIIEIPTSGFEFTINYDEMMLSLDAVERGHDWPEPLPWNADDYIGGIAYDANGPVERFGKVARLTFSTKAQGDTIVSLENLLIYDAGGNDITPSDIGNANISINSIKSIMTGKPVLIRE